MIHVYWNMVEELPDREVNFLSPVEEKRLAQMRFACRRQSFLLGRWTVKRLLEVHPGCAHLPVSSITIANHAAGAPYVLMGEKELDGCISISHRENIAASALVIYPGIAVGIDLELVEERENSFVEDFFTAKESAWIDSLPVEEKSIAVTCLWSAKEAVLKALGTGLRLDSRGVVIQQSTKACRIDGWQLLDVSGTALENRVYRVWWRVRGKLVLTLAVVGKLDLAPEVENIALEHVPAPADEFSRLDEIKSHGTEVLR